MCTLDSIYHQCVKALHDLVLGLENEKHKGELFTLRLLQQARAVLHELSLCVSDTVILLTLIKEL